MRPTLASTLWLELLGGLLIVLGALLAWWAYSLASYPPDSSLSRALAGVRVDFPGFLQGVAGRMATLGAVLAAAGALLFFAAAYLVRLFRWVLGAAVVFALGVWLRLVVF
ncbi:MAG: hypothetical protein C4328_03600 [Meiothermus sp.]